MGKLVSKFGIALLLMSLLGTSSLYLRKNKQQQEIPSLAPPLSDLPRDLIKILTLGHDRLYDDFIYIWLIQFLIPEKNTPLEPAPIVLRRTQNTLRLLPPIEYLYLLSCYIQAFQFKQPQVCKEILLKGMAAVPESWRIPMTLGYIYAFNLKDLSTGGHYYMVSSQQEGSPAYFASLGQKLINGDPVSIKDLQDSLKKIFEPSD